MIADLLACVLLGFQIKRSGKLLDMNIAGEMGVQNGILNIGIYVYLLYMKYKNMIIYLGFISLNQIFSRNILNP